VIHPVELYELSAWLWFQGNGFAGLQTVDWYVDPNPSPEDYGLGDIPGGRGEIHLQQFPFQATLPGRWHEFVFDAAALEVLNQLTTNPSWSGRLSLIGIDAGAITSGFQLWGDNAPFLRAGFQQAFRPTIPRGVRMSQIQIVNRGLQLLGTAPIASLTDPGEVAEAASLNYEGALDAILAEYPWNFATTRAEIAKSDTAPAWGFPNAYPQPPKTLVIWEVDGDDELDWDVEHVEGVGKCIVTAMGSPIRIKYTYRQEDEAVYSALFASALSARIAMELSEVLTRDQAIIENVTRIYNARLQRARQVDSQEQTPEKVKADLWSRARGQGRFILAKLDGPSGPLGY
jgi:hypothetical protein